MPISTPSTGDKKTTPYAQKKETYKEIITVQCVNIVTEIEYRADLPKHTQNFQTRMLFSWCALFT